LNIAAGGRNRPLHRQPAQRIGPVEDDHFDAVRRTGLEEIFGQRLEGPVAHPGVLQVDHHRIDARELRRARPLLGIGAAIEADDLQPTRAVELVVDVHVVGQRVDAMLAAEQLDHGHARHLCLALGAQHVDRALAFAVHADRIGEHRDAQPAAVPRSDVAQLGETAVLQHVDAGAHLRRGRQGDEQRGEEEQQPLHLAASSAVSTAVWIAGRALAICMLSRVGFTRLVSRMMKASRSGSI
jgi:hypothetical protein